MGNLVGRLENRMVTVVTASDLVNVNQLIFIASQEDEAKVPNACAEDDYGDCGALTGVCLSSGLVRGTVCSVFQPAEPQPEPRPDFTEGVSMTEAPHQPGPKNVQGWHHRLFLPVPSPPSHLHCCT